MTATALTNQIFDACVRAVRKHLPECRRRSRQDLEVLFGDLFVEVAEILEDANAIEDDEL